MTTATNTTTDRRSITFFTADQAPLLDDDGMMTPPHVDEEVTTTLDLSPLAAGSKVIVLFETEGPNPMSLVHAWFGPGYRLPRHSHSADCLYYVVAGEAHMGNRVIKAGDGFFVKAGQPYAYQAGPDGIQILEFRGATTFDMQIFDQTVAKWQPIVDAATANQHRWVTDPHG
jgi:quercetin dioxygenase-like cupin family protein